MKWCNSNETHIGKYGYFGLYLGFFLIMTTKIWQTTTFHPPNKTFWLKILLLFVDSFPKCRYFLNNSLKIFVTNKMKKIDMVALGRSVSSSRSCW